MKLGRDLAVGDLLVFLGTTHRIRSFEAYVHPTLGSARIARCELDWSMTVWDDDHVVVA